MKLLYYDLDKNVFKIMDRQNDRNNLRPTSVIYLLNNNKKTILIQLFHPPNNYPPNKISKINSFFMSHGFVYN